MSKKYVIEIKPEYEDTTKGVMVLGARESNLYVDTISIENLEELNSDYINEHFGQLQDEAYKRGINDGSLDVKQRVEGAYQRGLDDAWEAAKKIALMDTETSENVTGYFGLFRIMENLTPMQAIEKLKAYEEQKADDEIKVGDEVDCSGDSFIVTRIFHAITGKVECDGVDMDGCTYHDVLISGLTKTGRHFDIEKILEEMKE